MKSPRFAIENVLLHLSEHFTYLNSGEDKGVRIIEGLLYRGLQVGCQIENKCYDGVSTL